LTHENHERFGPGTRTNPPFLGLIGKRSLQKRAQNTFTLKVGHRKTFIPHVRAGARLLHHSDNSNTVARDDATRVAYLTLEYYCSYVIKVTER